jgi:hypothetical protein
MGRARPLLKVRGLSWRGKRDQGVMVKEQCRGQIGEPVGHGLEFEIACGAQRTPGNDALLLWRAEAAERFRQGTEAICPHPHNSSDPTISRRMDDLLFPSSAN